MVPTAEQSAANQERRETRAVAMRDKLDEIETNMEQELILAMRQEIVELRDEITSLRVVTLGDECINKYHLKGDDAMLSLGKLASRLGKSFRRNYESNFILSMRTMKPVESLEDCHNTVRSGRPKRRGRALEIRIGILKKAKLVVIAFEEDKQDLEARKLGLIVFGAIQQKRFTQRWGLMFTDIKINGQKIEALENQATEYEKALIKVLEMLKTSGDMMLASLQNRLPPQREIDHHIDVVLETHPPAHTSYRMSPPEFVKLKKQLGELLDAGFIQPSKSPYGSQFYSSENMTEPYFYDIVIYSKTLEEHVQHIRLAMGTLREHELYVKNEKCSFDPNKVKAILEWEPPTKVMELRSFLGLANYYRRFVKGYFVVTAPLTEMLKKGITWKWSTRSQQAFNALKQAICAKSVLALPDHTKSYEVHTDALDFAIKGVLIQEGHLVAYESRKLNDIEKRYIVQEKEMTVIVHYFRT
ncbi:Uncharacterized protein TCM_013099 [Theobroma cacao]|uniref:Reverse transcriptase/retrotransposon-derived protein RNase H-like domain-containing protein n=1 Tax=Theobroma cacao TaxID=3641 RepID=A0A061FWN2_THECC|nr:Uncharacterized protein TCM_013099 [Theobroma cacao]